jgi:hypothetical protein
LTAHNCINHFILKKDEVQAFMPKFSIAFVAPAENSQLKHRIMEGADQESALRSFFSEEAAEYYSNDDQGYFYFKEDFFDQAIPSGSVILCS